MGRGHCLVEAEANVWAWVKAMGISRGYGHGYRLR